MKGDPKSNYYIATVFRSQSIAAGATYAGEATAIDHASYPSASFLIDVSSVGSSGKLDAKLQYSEDNSTFTDEPDTTGGNSTTITQITAAGSALLHAPNPRGRYSRVVMKATTDACVCNVTAVAGPKRHVAAA